MNERICVIANPGSGQNRRDAEAISRAMDVFGDRANLCRWRPGADLQAVVDHAIGEGCATIVAAGGDGTAAAMASALIGKTARLAVLPLGTFNFFARGLGFPEDPAEAASAILTGRPHAISVGLVNGQVFLNNASLGIYPHILRARETTYARFGRRRLAAHWSVIKTFFRFQRPWRMIIEADGRRHEVVSPLLFVARSAYQLQQFGLDGSEAISNDAFAVFVARGRGRAALFSLAWRLVTRRLEVGRDVDLIVARDLRVHTKRRRVLVAFDGEKKRMATPLDFCIREDALSIVRPETAA